MVWQWSRKRAQRVHATTSSANTVSAVIPQVSDRAPPAPQHSVVRRAVYLQACLASFSGEYASSKLLRNVLRLWRKQTCAKRRNALKSAIPKSPSVARAQPHYRALHFGRWPERFARENLEQRFGARIGLRQHAQITHYRTCQGRAVIRAATSACTRKTARTQFIGPEKIRVPEWATPNVVRQTCRRSRDTVKTP